MASPFSMYVSPSRVKIDLLEPPIQGPNNNTSATSKKYRISNIHEFSSMLTIKAADLEDSILEGYISPTDSVTLPPAAKNKAGIPEHALYYSYMSAPENLAPFINWKKFNEQKSLDNPYTGFAFLSPDRSERPGRPLSPIIFNSGLSSDGSEDTIPTTNVKNSANNDEDFFENDPPTASDTDIANMSLMGAFVYFDKYHNVIQLNVLTLKETVFKVKLSGPFEGCYEASSAMFKLKRIQGIRCLNELHESGYTSYGWVRAGEQFGLDYATNRHKYPHGGFAMFREDGTFVFYSIETKEYLDPLGDVDTVADCFQNAQERLYSQDFTVSSDDIEINMERFQTFNVDMFNTTQNIRKSRRGVAAIHAAVSKGHDAFKSYLQTEKHAFELDERTWNALHYAVNFYPKDLELVQMIIKLSPKSVFEADHYGRLPLHIALGSYASEEVIAELLKADDLGTLNTVLKATNFLENLPLHIALSQSASRKTVEALLKGNERTIFAKTGVGRLPLHVALSHRASPDVIDLLLETYEDNMQQYEVELGDDIYEPFRGLLPIHIATWNNCPAKTISLLLERDDENDLIDEEVHLTVGKSMKMLASSMNSTANQDLYASHLINGMTPLHLALRHGSTETIHLLLQKEQQKRREDGELSIVERIDRKGRYPLHIACKKQDLKPSIVKDILDLDPYNVTTHVLDHKDCYPLHYACSHENASPTVIKNLIHAERLLVKYDKKLTAGDRSVYSSDKHNRTPINLALQSGAPQEVIRILLEPKNFTLKGFNRATIFKLSERVCKDYKCQELVIEQFAKRRFFSLFYLELAANMAALITFIIASITVLDDSPTIITFVQTLMLWLCIFFLGFREVAQMMTSKSNYLFDTWSWFQWAGILSLLVSLLDMIDFTPNLFDFSERKRRECYMVTGCLLILNLIFFLRAAFLPFARFVGGLLLIFQVLVPFFLVSCLLLLLFAYSYSVNPPSLVTEQPECRSIGTCYLWVLRGFFASETTNNWLDIIFGLVIVVVLLNVVIAIVCEAWDSAQTEKFYWNYRIQWLADARFLVRRDFQEHGPLAKYIDNISFTPIFSRNKLVYDSCESKKQYDNPYYYFNKSMADKISSSRSLRSNMFWATKACKDTKLMLTLVRIRVTISWLLSNLRYMFFIVAGFVTFGMLWPVKFRRVVLYAGNRNVRKEEMDDAQIIESIINQIQNESVKAELKVIASNA